MYSRVKLAMDSTWIESTMLGEREKERERDGVPQRPEGTTRKRSGHIRVTALRWRISGVKRFPDAFERWRSSRRRSARSRKEGRKEGRKERREEGIWLRLVGDFSKNQWAV